MIGVSIVYPNNTRALGLGGEDRLVREPCHAPVPAS